MAFECKIAADSLAPCGARLTTFIVSYPRAIHSEIMTHRMLTKSSASSRAIPVEKLIERVLADPWIPDYIGANQKGMQPGEELSGDARLFATDRWLKARDEAVEFARQLHGSGVHKGVVNRLLEPWMWITVIISGTEWENFFGLRTHEAAEPHFQHIARMMRDARDASTPNRLLAGHWHLPLIFDEDYAAAILMDPTTVMQNLVKVSVGRCARVSYLNHEGKRDLQADIDLHDRLMVQRPLHSAPAEHVAQAMDWPEWWKEFAAVVVSDTATMTKTLEGLSFSEVRQKYLENRNRSGTTVEQLAFLSAMAHGVSEMQSGNYGGFLQYRKQFGDENIGGLMP